MSVVEYDTRGMEGLRLEALSMLRKRFASLCDADREDAVQIALLRLCEKADSGETVDSPRNFVLNTAWYEALNLRTKVQRKHKTVAPDSAVLAGVEDTAAHADERVLTMDEARRAREIVDSLDPRLRDFVKLKHDLALHAREIRDALGINRRQYQRLAEDAANAIADKVAELEDGRWESRQRSLLRACLVEVPVDGTVRVGIASARQRRRAQRLVNTDPAVAALLAELRTAAALLPLPAVAGFGDSASTADGLGRLKAALSDLVAAAKHNTTAAYLRVADPAPLAGVRPAPVVATVACLAVGGAGYCAVEGPPDWLRQPEPPARTAPAPAPLNPAPVADVLPDADTVLPREPSVRAPLPARTRQPDVSEPPAPSSEEFGPEAGGAVPRPSPTPQAPPAPTTPPAPTGDPATQDFGFER